MIYLGHAKWSLKEEKFITNMITEKQQKREMVTVKYWYFVRVVKQFLYVCVCVRERERVAVL